jgi:peptidyl-dipeptidase A
MVACFLLLVAVALAPVVADDPNFDEMVNRVMNGFEKFYKRSINKGALANWVYSTNITDANSLALNQARLDQEEFSKMYCKVIEDFILKNVTNVKNDTLNRWVGLVVGNGCGEDNANRTERSKRINQLSANIQSMYSTAKVELDGKLYPLDPDLYEIMRRDRNFTKLLHVWKGWYDNSTKYMKPLYKELVELWNEVSVESGFKDRGAQWKSIFEHPDPGNFENDLEKIWQKIKPLYEKIHAYTRDKLKTYYGNYSQFFPSSRHMPAHILTNMWAQAWGPLEDILLPYPSLPSINIGESLIIQNYSVRMMFNKSDEFFQSLGLKPMPESFWQNSMLERPADGREVVCHASAWNLMNGDDVRIKMCTKKTHEDFLVIHHEMGHIMYYLYYNDKPAPFQTGANPGFHEAIGDAISLSVNTPKHLKRVNLIGSNVNYTQEMQLNYLMKTALEKIVFFPFGYLVDLWRWKVFDGRIKENEYSKTWWDLVCKYQGVYPPVTRNPGGFDPGAKYHIPANSQYISYFIAHVLQFSFYKRMCDLAGQGNDLVNCDYFNSIDAGSKFRDMMKWGYSQHWTKTLLQFTGDSTYNTTALLDYFKPLEVYLDEYLSSRSITTGWDEGCPLAPDAWNSTTTYKPPNTETTTTRASTTTFSTNVITSTPTKSVITSSTATSISSKPSTPPALPPDESKGLSDGAWVGIGVGSAAGVAAVGGGVGAAVYFFVIKPKAAVAPLGGEGGDAEIPMS